MSYPQAKNNAYGSFFERLEADASIRSVTQRPDPVDVVNSVKRNISRLLNARLGESLSAPELGLVDFNDATLGSQDLALQIRRAIRHCIERYEPRIEDLDIRVLPDTNTPLKLKFHIVATVHSGAMHDKVQIDLLLDSNRSYRVV